MATYIPDPSLIDVPLHADEIDQIVASGGVALRTAANAQHFAQRTKATVESYKEQLRQLHKDVSEIRAHREMSGAPTTLAPMDAVKFLSPAQLTQLFGTMSQQQLNELRRLQADARGAQRDAAAAVDIVAAKLTELAAQHPQLRDPITELIGHVHTVGDQLRATPSGKGAGTQGV